MKQQGQNNNSAFIYSVIYYFIFERRWVNDIIIIVEWKMFTDLFSHLEIIIVNICLTWFDRLKGWQRLSLLTISSIDVNDVMTFWRSLWQTVRPAVISACKRTLQWEREEACTWTVVNLGWLTKAYAWRSRVTLCPMKKTDEDCGLILECSCKNVGQYRVQPGGFRLSTMLAGSKARDPSGRSHKWSKPSV